MVKADKHRVSLSFLLLFPFVSNDNHIILFVNRMTLFTPLHESKANSITVAIPTTWCKYHWRVGNSIMIGDDTTKHLKDPKMAQ